MIVTAASTPDDKDFFNRVTGYVPTSDFRGIKGIQEDGEVVAMCGMDQWTPNACNIHIWYKDDRKATWTGKQVIEETMRHLFVTHGRGLVIGVTAAHNSRCLKFQRILGFTELFRVKDGWAIGVDTVYTELRKENCKWLRPAANVELISSSA